MEWKLVMRLDNIKQPKTDGFNVFASLPDMGKVGGLVSAYLAKNLKSECIAEIVSNEKPWVSYIDGVVKTVSDLYQLYYNFTMTQSITYLFSQEIHSYRTQPNSINYARASLIIFRQLAKSGVYTAQVDISANI